MFRHFLQAFALTLAMASSATAQEDMRQITGQLTYLPKIALPDTARVTVAAQGSFQTELDVHRFQTDGAQVPLAFQLTVPTGVSGAVSAVIHITGAPWWGAQDIPFTAGDAPVDLEMIRLERFTPLTFAARFECGGNDVLFGVLENQATLRINGQDFEMIPAISASGARYVSKSDDTTEFWSKGDTAMITVAGEALPDCVKVDDSATPYRAGGNEPGWHVTVGPSDIKVVANYGALTRSTPRPDVHVVPGGYVFDMPGINARLTLEDTLCRDDATGMPHPHRATLDLDGRALRGCGGDPASLLTGDAWQIKDVAGHGIFDGSNTTVRFGDKGRASGSTGCNRFTGGYDLTGEGLRFGQMGVTMMACPARLMAQERRVLEAFDQVRRFDFDETGALVLIGGPEGTPLLTARRP